MENESLRTIHIGLAGFGNVGAGVYKNLKKNAGLLRGRTGVELSIKRVAVKDPTKERGIELPAGLLTGDWRELVADPAIGVIVELIGGVTEAFELVKAALRAKKAVVTGNKALLAEHGKELIALAEEEDVPLYLEAAVAGGIPIIKAVREALIGNHILSIHGIINGTSNFILTRMDEAGISFADALAEAQAHGYAEADPALDINGWDAGHKAIILAWLSYGLWLKPDEVLVEGIENLQLEDIRNARQLGYAVKLLAVIRLGENGRAEVRVGPSLVPSGHILANVNGVFNAVALRGDVVGETLFYGSGAGQDATSSAVIADLADAADNLVNQAGNNGFAPHGHYGTPIPAAETESAYYLRLSVDDVPGVLAKVAAALGERGVGISSVIQREAGGDGIAPLILMTHRAKLGTMQDAVAALTEQSFVRKAPVLLRVEVV